MPIEEDRLSAVTHLGLAATPRNVEAWLLDGPRDRAAIVLVPSLGMAESDKQDIFAISDRGMGKPYLRLSPVRRLLFERSAWE